jgi:1-acyl-sn-glycerol-3-phosphate acyltransferase
MTIYYVAAGICAVAVALFPKLYFLRTGMKDIWTHEDPHWLGRMFYGSVQSFAKFWHRYEVHGLENVTKNNCLLVGYHSRCTTDGVYATAFVAPTTIMSPIFFAVPFSKRLFSRINCVSTHSEGMSSSESFIDTVVNGKRPTLLFPGGHHECYKPVNEKYKAMWKELPGYARILLEEPQRPGQDTTVVPFYTHNCEEIYASSDWWYDYSGKAILKDFHDFENGKLWILPLLMPKSLAALGMILLPRPVKLDLYFGPPVKPLPKEDAKDFARRVREAMQTLIDDVRKRKAISEEKEEKRTMLSMFCRYPIYTTYAVVQNAIMWSSFILLNTTIVPFAMIGMSVFNLIYKKNSKRTHHTKNN